jgi:hypothetical protein
MSNTGKQSPLGANVLSSVLQNIGLTINAEVTSRAGVSYSVSNYTMGTVVKNTCLRLLTYAINDGYVRGIATSGSTVYSTLYNNLISIGLAYNNIGSTNITSTTTSFTVTHGTSVIAQFPADTYIMLGDFGPAPPTVNPYNGYNGFWLIESSTVGSFTVASTLNLGTPANLGLIYYGESIPALGNSKPPTFNWTGPANTSDSTDSAAQIKSWMPYDATNNITQWGYLRLPALQAWNEFNWNGDSATTTVIYKDFVASFQQASSFIDYSNVAINSMANSKTFLEGTFSNMDDLMTADVSGVSLATREFGQDLVATGKVIDLSKLSTFGLPSQLLLTLKKYNAITQSLSLALLSSGLAVSDIDKITSNTIVPTVLQEQQIYGAFLILVGVDLADILIPVNCKTEGLNSLADLLNPMKLFPNSYQSLTVPIYNASPSPTNSKTYYPIYIESGINPALISPAVVEQLGGPQIPPGAPPIIETQVPIQSLLSNNPGNKQPQLELLNDSTNQGSSSNNGILGQVLRKFITLER